MVPNEYPDLEFGGRNDLGKWVERLEDEGGTTSKLQLSCKSIPGRERLAKEPRRPPSTQQPSHPRGARKSNAPVKQWGWFSSGRTGLTEPRREAAPADSPVRAPSPPPHLQVCMNAGG